MTDLMAQSGGMERERSFFFFGQMENILGQKNVLLKDQDMSREKPEGLLRNGKPLLIWTAKKPPLPALVRKFFPPFSLQLWKSRKKTHNTQKRWGRY